MDRRHVTLAEAAAIAGTSLDTIRRRLKKGELQKAQTNQKGIFVDLESLREAFDLPPDAGKDKAPETAEAEAALKSAIKGLQDRLGEMRLAMAQAETKHVAELAGVQGKLDVAAALADARQAEIDRLHGICRASAQQLPSMENLLVEERERHRAALRALQDQMKAEAARAHDQLAALKARPWWRRLAG
ncbi:hypothetical protein [Heyndrickxia sporothermodurans]